MQLHDFANRHACDKGRHGPSQKWPGTNYADIYQAYLHHRRHEIGALLEIGLGVDGPNWHAEIVHGRNPRGGASVKMWADYLPNAKITGVDINPASFLDNERITTYQVDQGDREQWRRFLKNHPDPHFDIIVDDGSHRPDHQQISLEMLWPALKSGGTYFIEDLNDFGLNGREGGRFGNTSIVTTRQLFKRFQRSNVILGPNAFESTNFFAEISDVLFYCPRPLQRPRDIAVEAIRTVIGRGKRGLSRREWADDSEMIVALRKRA